jgi:phage shock protein PspC (stress-responsive transcriptional regulator)
MDGRLTRSRRERMIGGVAGGMGQYLGVDPTWVRIAWVVIAFATNGAGVLVYLLLLVVIPEGDRTDAAAEAATDEGRPVEPGMHAPAQGRPTFTRPPIDSGQGALILGGILVAVGAWALIGQYVDIDWRTVWPVGLVVAGILIMAASVARRR